MRCQVKDVKNSKRNHCRIKDKDFCAEFDGKKCAVEKTAVAVQRVLEDHGKFGFVIEPPESLEYGAVLGSD